MKSEYKRLGDYIQLVDVRNKEMAVTRLLGININKQFMPSVANVSSTDLSRYKLISNGMFACNVMHVGRDERIPIAFYTDDEPAIISPAYIMFRIVNDELLPEFLMMHLQRPEFDRYAGYICDSSIRGGLEWERFCDIQIPIPDIKEQRKYVALYKALQKNQQAYEKSLDDLQLICDTYIEDLIKSETKKVLGEYIEKLDYRNYDGSIKNVMGMSVLKEFRTPSVKVNMRNLSNYRVVNYNEFAYVQTTNNEKVLIVCLSKFNRPIIISSVNIVFKITNEKVILPEYLYAFFKRTEMDRYARFHSWGSARETFDWADMCNVKLPIPKIEVQESIVAIHHTLETRKRLNNELKKQTQNLCPILMRGIVEGLSTNERENVESREVMG
jgi:type I restriction enzyme, S subunit